MLGTIRLSTILLIATIAVGPIEAQDARRPANSEAEAENSVIRRYLDALEKVPRRGTALDRVYGLHVERGKLDELIDGYRVRAGKGAGDGTSWMVVGLLESQRGRDTAAVEAFRRAESLRPGDSLASHYLGQSLVLAGQPKAAVEAFERAIARAPATRTPDLLESYQALGRVYQRENRPDEAMAVWRRLEAKFPDDPRVRERIAASLVEDGLLQPALERFEALAARTDDRARRPSYRAAVADLKARLGRRAEAVADLQRLVDDLPPGEWPHRDAQRRLEEVFLKADDLTGLVAYYEGRVKASPEDLPAASRLARHLLALGKIDDARARLEAAVKRAPGAVDLRMELATLLVDQQDIPHAIEQFEQTDRQNPGDPDVLREWGMLLLRDPVRPEADRKKAAVAAWKRMLPAPGARPDKAMTEQVAELCRQAGATDEALALYRQAVAIGGNDPGPRTHLGEYLHALGRRDEALAAWRGIAEGPARNASNLRILADVLSSFDRADEAISTLAQARTLAPEDLGMALQQADLLAASGRLADALAVLEGARRLAKLPEQAEDVLTRQLRVEMTGGTLARRADELAKTLEGNQAPDPDSWYRLARYREELRQWPAAEAAIDRALKGEPRAEVLASAARILEAAGRPAEACEILKRLAQTDPKARAEHLRQWAAVESRLGRVDRAMAAGRELLDAAPNDPSNYRFVAQLCLKVGARDEATAILRRAVRADPNDPSALAALAEALVESGRPEEAIELDWRAFAATDEPAAKQMVVAALAGLYLRLNQFDRLIERLDRLRRDRAGDPEARRVLTLCVAQAHQAGGALGEARAELERLLADRPDDVAVLEQLVALAEREGDLSSAIGYQRHLAKLSPGNGRARLVGLLLSLGEKAEAIQLWREEAASTKGVDRLLELADNLLFFDQPEEALATVGRILRDHPHDWEALYREGLALVRLKRRDEADVRFKAVLDLHLSENLVSALISPRDADAARGGSILDRLSPDDDKAFLDRLTVIPLIRQAVVLNQLPAASKSLWTPGDFGQARAASLLWRHTLAGRRRGGHAEFLATLRADRGDPVVDPRGWWDWFYLHQTLNDDAGLREAARALVRTGQPEGHWAYLVYFHDTSAGNASAEKPASEEEITQALASFRTLRQKRAVWIDQPEVAPLLAALKLAGRTQDQEAVLREAAEAAITVKQIVTLMDVVAERGDVDLVLRLHARLDGKSWAVSGPRAYPGLEVSIPFMRLIDRRAEAGSFDDVARILEAFLTAERRRTEALRLAMNGATPAPQPSMGTRSFYVGSYTRSIDMQFPAPGDHLDADALNVLADAFMLYEKNNRLPELRALIETRLNRAAPGERAFDRMILCGLRWWEGDRPGSLEALAAAVEASPNAPIPRLELARMNETLRRSKEALAAIDAAPTPDVAATMFREMAALRVAVRFGDVDRVRLAAERLFPIRLDATTSVEISALMRRIGMHEQANMVLDRARPLAGANLEALVGLALEYRVQNRLDVSSELAQKILDITRPVASFQRGGAANADRGEAQARTTALTFLARSGRLAAMAERVEAQARARPRAFALLQTLNEYYTTLGDKAKVTSTLERMVSLRPGDAALRFRLATDIAASGNEARALPLFLEAIREDASLYFQNGSATVLPYFRKADKLDQLIAALERDDSDTLNVAEVVQLLTIMLPDPKLHDAGVRMLKASMQKADYRPGWLLAALLGVLRPEFEKLPDADAILRAEMIPNPEDVRDYPWYNVDSDLATILSFAAERGQLDALARALDDSLKSRPGWVGAGAIQALIDIRRGRLDEAREAVGRLLAIKEPPMPEQLRSALATTLAEHVELLDLAIRVAEAGISRDDPAQVRPSVRQYDPSAYLLVNLYHQAGRDEEARALALSSFRSLLPENNRRDGESSGRNFQASIQVASQMLTIGDRISALRGFTTILDRSAGDDSVFNRRQTRVVGNTTYITMTGNQFPQALEEVKTAEPREVLDRLIPETPRDEPAVDLLSLVHPRDPVQATMFSALDTSMKAAHGDAALLSRVRRRIERAEAATPEALVPAIASALAALASEGEDAGKALGRIERWVVAHPLDATPLDASKRAAAAEQIDLWFPARRCLVREEHRRLGAILGERALEAARRQSEPAKTLAILREWGRIDAARGDRAAARARWSAIVALLDEESRLVALAPVAKEGPAAPLLPEHCTQLLDLARMIVDLGEVELSLDLVSQALRNGPPSETAAQGQTVVAAGAEDTEGICYRLLSLGAIWRERQAPPDRVYDVLRTVVLPAARPSETFLYALDMANIVADSPESVRPRSVGLMLCEWAARAGRLDELARAIEPRLAVPLTEVPAHVLLAQIGRLRGDAKMMGTGLDWLDRRLDRDSGSLTLSLIAHAALDALAWPEGKAKSVAVLEHLIRIANVAQPGVAWPGTLSLEITRERLVHDDLATARERIGRYVDEIDRVNNDSFSSVRIGSRRAFALCLNAGYPSLAWEALGREADREANSFDNSFVGTDLERLFAGVASKPAVERFAFLKGWVLPTDPKKPVRLVVVENPADGDSQRWSSGRGLANTFGLLIDVARESGQLDALAVAIKPHVEAKGRDAEALALMVDIARGRLDGVEARALDRVKGLTRPKDDAQTPPAPSSDGSSSQGARGSWLDGMIALACLEDPSLRSLGEEMAGRLLSAPAERRPPGLLDVRLRSAWASGRIAREAGVPRVAARLLGPTAWVADKPSRPDGPAEGWVALEGHLALIPGSPLLPLRLRVPLTGDFEFTCEGTDSCGIGYGGLTFSRPISGGSPADSFASPFEAPADPAAKPRPIDAVFHSYRLRVAPAAIRCWVDGRLVYQSSNQGLSYPWLSLEPSATPGVPVVVRNPKITGRPEAMAEVDLVGTGHLTWTSSSASALGQPGVKSSSSLDAPAPDPWSTTESEAAWTSKDGEIRGSRIDSADGRPQHTLLTYDRRLIDGESIRYEFLARPGEIFVHPAIGRRVLLLSPEGPSLRVLSSAGDTLMVDEPGHRAPERKPLPLKLGDWNTLTLNLAPGLARWELNGQAIAETEIRPDDDVRFGLFYTRDQYAARVRLAVLNNPSAALVASALAAGPALSVEDRKIARAWIGEPTLRRNAFHVVEKAKGLDPAGRFDALLAWVMPEAGAISPRLDGEFRRARAAEAPDTVADPEAALGPVEAVVPAVELIAAAKLAGRLDELAGRLPGVGDDPARLALAALIAASRGLDEETSSDLDRLRARVPAGPAAVGWPEFVAATAGLKIPATRAAALALLDASADAQPVGHRGAPLPANLRHRAELAHLVGLPAEPGAAWPALSHWLPSIRDDELPRAFWTWQGGDVRHLPGNPGDRLTFALPLLGDFELTCKMRLDLRHTLAIEYGGQALEFASDGKTMRVVASSSSSWNATLDPPVDISKDWHDYRLTVRSGKAEVALDGRVVYSGRLDQQGFPWLALRTGSGGGGARDLKLDGHPVVPAELDLATGQALAGWSALDPTLGGEAGSGAWLKLGDEIRGHRSNVALGRDQESVLTYDRPMSSEDSIEYEFQYIPEELLVHPVLGQIAFLLDREGISIHQIGDRELTSDNRRVEPSWRRGPARLPLVEGGWNHLRLTLTGERSTIELNGVLVYECPFDRSKPRTFGLFYFADQTSVRVRRARFRVSRPKLLTDRCDFVIVAPDPLHPEKP